MTQNIFTTYEGGVYTCEICFDDLIGTLWSYRDHKYVVGQWADDC